MLDKATLITFFEQFLMARGVHLTHEQLNDFNFMQSGLLDSFEMLSMVMQIDTEFNVKLSPEQMLSPETETVGGLINVILAS